MLACVIPLEALHPATDPALAAELVALQRDAYAVEERLIGHPIPVAADDPGALAAAGLVWWGCRDPRDGGVVGAVAVRDTEGLLDVERLFVAPGAFRRGVGSALVAHVVAQAAGRRVVVATGRDNAPARALYERAGFTVVDHAEVEPGLWVTHYAR
jgi:ribosomal protein S18 acetylase RimI-like enzyme